MRNPWSRLSVQWLLLLFLGLAAVCAKEQKGVSLRMRSGGARSTGMWALIIGVGHYTDPAIRSIPFCVQDVRDLGEVLRASGYQVVELSDQASEEPLKPTKNNILVQAKRLLIEDERIRPEDIVVIYFSGHGYAGESGAYLVASDTYESQVEKTGVKVADLRELVQACRATRRLLILDACHSGSGKAAERSAADTINAAAQGQGMLTLASCRGNEKSWEMSDVDGKVPARNSAFTHFLMKGLRGQADADHNGEIGILELSKHVHDSVTAWARSRQLEQTPRMLGEIEGDMVVVGRPTPGALALNSEPWAEVLLDGQARGKTPCVLEDVSPGSHVVTFRSSTSPIPIERDVTVKPGEELRLSVTFPRPK